MQSYEEVRGELIQALDRLKRSEETLNKSICVNFQLQRENEKLLLARNFWACLALIQTVLLFLNFGIFIYQNYLKG